MLSISVAFSAFALNPEEAKRQLKQEGIQYTVNAFIKSASDGKPADPFNNGSILLLINKSNTPSEGTPAYAFAWDFQSTDTTKHGLELMKLKLPKKL